MSKDVAIGIDLGTSNSCVAVVRPGGPQVLANAYGERTTASVVAFGEDGSVSVGNQAKARVILDPKHTVSSSKRLIGRYFFSEEVKKARAICRYEIVDGENNSVRIEIRGTQYSLPELSAMVLKEMKAVADSNLEQPVAQAVLTVPAYFNDNQRQATKDAGRIAGLEVLRILNEPTAAALAYGYGKDLKQTVAVYDLGGGTFDVSVLEIAEDVFEVLATCGDSYLGGEDFDDRLIDLLAERVQAEHGVNVRTDPFALEKLKAAAEKAKIELSSSDPVQVSISGLAEKDGEPIGLDYELGSEEFDKLTRDLIQRTFKVCDEALQQAGLTVSELDGIILVGGPTRLPTVREAVRDYFQREPEVDINPDEVVAIGAAIHAHSLVSDDQKTCLLDVTPLSLKIGIAGGMTETIIDRNSPVPIDHTRIFTTVQDDQEAVSVRIYQGESRQAADNALLGQFDFTGFAPGPRGEVQIEVTFAISTEGIVKVSARDPRTNAERSTTVSMSSGLSPEELQEILARAREEAKLAPPPTSVESDPLASPESQEFLDLPSPESEVAPELNPAASQDFGAMQEDLALPDDAEIAAALESEEESGLELASPDDVSFDDATQEIEYDPAAGEREE